MTQSQSVPDRIGQIARARRGGEDQIAIHGRMTGQDRARHAIMCGDGQPGGLCLGQHSIGCDDGDGGRLAGGGVAIGFPCRGQTPDIVSPEFALDFPRCCKKPPIIVADPAKGVYRHQCPDGYTAIENERCRPKPPGQIHCRRPEPGPDGPEVELHRSPLQRGPTQRRIGIAVPGLVAAIQQIEQDRSRHNRNPLFADREPSSRSAQPVRHT